MIKHRCTFCGKQETPDVWVCSTCVSKLLAFSQDELKKGLCLAQKKNFKDKAEALKHFIKEDYYGKISTISRCVNRKRSNRVSRTVKRTVK